MNCVPQKLSCVRAVVLLALTIGSGCLGFDPTPPPAAEVVFSLDLPAGSEVALSAHDEYEKKIVEATVTVEGKPLTLVLPASRDYVALRVSARVGQRLLKAVVPTLARGQRAEIGALGARSTAVAQLVQEKIAGQGGSFASMPESAYVGLVEQIRDALADSTTMPEIAAFEAEVKTLVDAAPLAAGDVAVFHDLDARIDDDYAKAAKLPAETVSAYTRALAAAIEQLRVPIVCDASLIKVMFTVDLSGEAKDGNGVTQFIRQPPKAGKVYLAITVDDSSPLPDSAGLLKPQMVPNDADNEMVDDGTAGDEIAGDGVYTRVLVLPRGMRVKYKYTNGVSGQGWTRAEEWPGNARLLEVRDVLAKGGQPDCLVIRRDAFGDEASNKNHVNLHTKIKAGGGNLGWDDDLGGSEAAPSSDGFYAAGLKLGEIRERAPLTPTGLPETVENGACERCPAPLTASADDTTPPRLLGAAFLSTTRIKVSFSEALEFTSANEAQHYAIKAPDGRRLPVLRASSAGSQVFLEVEGPNLSLSYTLTVSNLKDASANQNPLQNGASVTITPDYTPPKVLSLRSAPLRDLNPGSTGDDPTVGQVVVVTFDEQLEKASAENIANYRIQSFIGNPLALKAAILKRPNEVWLVTDPQKKRRPYELSIAGVRDLSRNPLPQGGALRFSGFALFKMTFGAVPGFAFLDLAGSQRGLPPGSKLYLTGTVLAVARDLDGNSIAIGGRTDVTGVPAFEMKPSKDLYQGEPVYKITLLAPPGTYAWKVAHGVDGEWKQPPATLVKVHKSLCTSNDGAGVEIDPVTLSALGIRGADGKPAGGIDYSAATLSAGGDDKPGPFKGAQPQPKVMFKRENPDEICIARSSDVVCPSIVIGTWRDLPEFTSDYDDGLPDVAPHRLQPDTQPPQLMQLKVFSSYSLILSFDERLASEVSTFSFSAKNAASGEVLPLRIKRVGTIGDAELLPSQIWLKTDKDQAMGLGETYTLSYSAIADAAGNAQKSAIKANWTAPTTLVPDEDTKPPAVLAVLPKSPTRLLVQFDEAVDPQSGAKAENYSVAAKGGGAALTITGATLAAGGSAVALTTSSQTKLADYTLTIKNVADTATPPNTLTTQTVDFKGFGDDQPPKVLYAAAISNTEVVVAFDEPLSPLTVVPGSFSVAGLTVTAAAFSGAKKNKDGAFSPTLTTFSENIVVLTTSAMSAGKAYSVAPSGVTDLTGNACTQSRSFNGVDKAATVDVVLSYRISGAEKVGGLIPARAISPADLSAQREGVFILGGTGTADGGKTGDPTDDVSKQMGTFPPEGQPTAGLAKQLADDGQNGDVTAGDDIYSIRIADVPLGSYLLWKAFASYTVAFKNQNPNNLSAAFADAPPGPSVFADGQEFPGNENGVRILGDADGDGVVRVECLFGDEITYKKFTNVPVFVWAVDNVSWKK